MSSSSPSEDSTGGKDFVKQSTLYQEFLAEREEILRHKWIESERLGHDIGFERALLDWIRKYRDSWRAARRTHSHPPMKAAHSHGSAPAHSTSAEHRP